MTQAAVCLKSRLILKVAPAAFIRILSVTPDEQTLDPIVIYRPYEGGPDEVLSMTEFSAKFPNAELGLPEIKRGDVFQVAGGVRKEVLAAVMDEAACELMLVLRPDNGAEAEEVAASDFLSTKPERIVVH
ncbi:MAG: hypothetical protein ACEQSB_03645 [Undibacterium sp.]